MLSIRTSLAGFAVVCCLVSASKAYEIPNHADMSQTAAEKSSATVDVGNGRDGKLFRIGLKQFPLTDPRQTFPLASALPKFPICFGVLRDSKGEMVANPATQPPWNTDSGRTVLTIANLIRYGACYEDNTEMGDLRSLAHFYDPQNAGAWLAVGPSSPDWMLKLGASSVNSGFHRHKLGIASM